MSRATSPVRTSASSQREDPILKQILNRLEELTVTVNTLVKCDADRVQEIATLAKLIHKNPAVVTDDASSVHSMGQRTPGKGTHIHEGPSRRQSEPTAPEMSEDDEETEFEIANERRSNAFGEPRSRQCKATEALQMIQPLKGQDDCGVEEFIKSVRFARNHCKEPEILLRMIKVSKISGLAERSIRYTPAETYEELFESLRTQVKIPQTINGCRRHLQAIRQGTNESVQSYSLRFKEVFSELTYAIQAKHRGVARRLATEQEIEEYEYEIEYKKGKDNVVADALSRLHPTKPVITSDIHISPTGQMTETIPTTDELLQPLSPATEQMIKEIIDNKDDMSNIDLLNALTSDGSETETCDTNSIQHPQDEQLLNEYYAWKQGKDKVLHAKHTANREQFVQINKDMLGDFNDFRWFHNLNHLVELHSEDKTFRFGISSDFTKTEQLEIELMITFITRGSDKNLFLAFGDIRNYTKQEKLEIIREAHNGDYSMHLGENKTRERIKERHFWKSLDRDVEEFIKTCDICQKNKLTRIRPREEAIIPDTPLNPNDKIAMDLIGPFPKTKRGNTYILSIQDLLTKYLILIPMKDQRAESIINNLLEHYIYIFSSPKNILTDQGQNFVCKLMESFENAFKIKHVKTTSFHPQSNGSLENHLPNRNTIVKPR